MQLKQKSSVQSGSRTSKIILTHVLSIRWLSISILLMILIGCTYYETDQNIDNRLAQVDVLKAKIKANKKNIKNLKRKSDAELFGYFKKDGWNESFDQADIALERVKSIHKYELQKILKTKPLDNDKYLALMDSMDRQLALARNLIDRPAIRQKIIETIYNDIGYWKLELEKLYQQSEQGFEKIKSAIDQAIESFPEQKNQINSRLNSFTEQFENVTKNYQRVQTIEINGDEKLDYLAAADMSEGIENLNKSYHGLKKDINDLALSYRKQLVDMRIDHGVYITMYYWDNSRDCCTKEYIYQKALKVSAEEFNYLLDHFSDKAFSRLRKNRSKWAHLNRDKKIHSILNSFFDQGYQPIKQIRNPLIDQIEFWVSEWQQDYWHRYDIEQQGKVETTDWQQVDELTFMRYYQALGMDILSKPLGVFEDQAISSATPPGMSYVGNPHYGEWRQDAQTGNSFWHYYGQYALLNTLINGGRYYRGDYDAWNRDYRNKRGYYRSRENDNYYGTSGASVLNSARYRNSEYSKRGGSKQRVSSVRGAGVKSRNKGPGGAGK